MEPKQMNTQNTTITKRRIGVFAVAILAIGLLPILALAHGGEEHVTGTVAKIADASVTVKTTAGKSVDVGFDAKTTYSRAAKPVTRADIKMGDRVVIHAVEVNEKLVAHTVELGAAASADKTGNAKK
jgi:hypothetical protein